MAKANGARLLGYDEKESEKEKEAQRKEQHGPSFLWLPGEKHLSLFTGNLSGFCPEKRSKGTRSQLRQGVVWGIGALPHKQFCRAKCRVCTTLHCLPVLSLSQEIM